MRRVQQNEVTKSSTREIDAEKVELVTKADTEKKVARILELIKNESQSRKRGAKNSKRDSELVGLVEDFLRQYQSLYAQYDNLMRERDKNDTRRSKRDNSPSTSSSDSEYFSSEDVDNNSGESRHDRLAAKTVPQKLEDDNKEMIILRNHLASIRKERETLSTEHMAALSKIKESENVINDLRVEVSERKRELSTLSKKHQVLEVEASLRTKELEGQIGGLKSELQSLRCHKSDLEAENVIKDLRVEVSERKRELLALSKKHQVLEVEASRRTKELEGQIGGLKSELQSLRCHRSDLEAENVIKDLRVEVSERKRVLSTLSKKHQVLEVEASRRTKELEGQIGGLKSELQSLHCHNSDLEAEIQSQASEAKQLKLENEELQARIMELELISESKEIEMSDLLKKLDNNENSAKSRFAELEEQVRNLQMEARSLHVEKCTMEETVQRLQNKLLANEKDLDQINTLNEEVKLLESQIAKFQEREAVIEQNLIRIRTLEEELASTFEEKERVSEENNCLAAQVKDMKLKMDALSARENDLLEQIRNHVHETNQCREEKEELEVRFVELESKSIERGNELSALQEKLKADGDAYSSHISALTVRAKKLQEDVNSLLALKRQLELHNEKDRQESSPRFNVVLKDSKSSEQEVITPRRMARKYRQARSSLQEPMDAQFLERRMEELADEFRMHFEDNVRLMSQRILVLEQLHMENKDSYKMMKERFQREHGALKDRSYIFKAEMGKIADASRTVSNALHRLDLIVSKFGEQNGNVLSRMSKVSKEIQCLRNKVSGTKDKVRCVTSDAIHQISAVDTKAMKNVVLSEESWALMAKVDDEGMEKMLMMKAVDRLEKRVAELENIAKVREEVLFGLVDEKKEAIRQLCLSINYYRDRCLQYREVISKIAASRRRCLAFDGLVRRPQSARIESVEAARGRLTRLKEIESGDMTKHRFRDSIKSLFGSHIDPEEGEQLKGTKSEIEAKVNRILKLIRDEHPEEDNQDPAGDSKRRSLEELVSEFHRKYQSLYERYDSLTAELRKKVSSKRSNDGPYSSSSDSDSDSDHSSKKGSKNGQLENDWEKITADMKQELETANLEVADLKRKLTSMTEERESLQSECQVALSKVQEAENSIQELNIKAERLEEERSKHFADNQKLTEKLEMLGKLEVEQKQRLEDTTVEKETLITEREAALKKIEEGEKNTTDLRNSIDQIKDERAALELELESMKGHVSGMKEHQESAEQKIAELSHSLEVTLEENKSLASKVSELSHDIENAQKKIQDVIGESGEMRKTLDEKERELLALTEVHQVHQNDASAQMEGLKAQIANLELELETVQTEKRDIEELIETKTVEAKQLAEENMQLRAQAAEFEEMLKAREDEMSALKKKLEDSEKESLSRTEDLTTQMKTLLHDLESLQAQKAEMEEQIVSKTDEASTQLSGLLGQVNTLQQELGSLGNQKAELELQLEKKSQELSENMVQTERLKEDLTRKTIDREKIMEEKEGLACRVKDLDLETATIRTQKDEMEERIRTIEKENDLLREEKAELQRNVLEFQETLDSLQGHKSELELQLETKTRDFSDFSTQMEGLKQQLASDRDHHQKTTEEKDSMTARIQDLMLEVDSLINHRVQLEEQIKSKSIESDQLQEEKRRLQDRVLELERKLSEKEDEFSALREKLELGETEASAKMMALETQINNLREDLDLLQSQKTQLELQLEKERQESSESVMQMENQKSEVAKQSEDLRRLLKEKEDAHKMSSADLMLEVDSLINHRSQLEEQIRSKSVESDRLQEEKRRLQDRVLELERKLSEKEDEFSALREKLEQGETEASAKMMALETQINNLREDLDLSQSQKTQLELQLEKERQESSESMMQMENQKSQVAKQSEDLRRLLQEKEDAHKTSSADLMLKVDSLINHRSELEEQIRSKSVESDRLQEEKRRLQDRVLELERKLSEKEDEFSALCEKLEQGETEALAKMMALETQINNLREDLDLSQNQKTQLELQLEKERQESSESMMQMENQKSEVAKQSEDLRRLLKEKEDVHKTSSADLMLEVDSLINHRSQLEEQIRSKSVESDRLQEEKRRLQDRVLELERKLSEKEDEFSALREKLEQGETEALAKMMALETQINNLREDLDLSQSQKTQLELQLEKERQESSESMMQMENQKSEVANQSEDLRKLLKEKEDAHKTLSEEHTLVGSFFQKCKENLERAESRMKEMEAEFRSKFHLRDQTVADLEEMVEDLRRDQDLKEEEISSLTENVRNIEVKLRLSNQKLRVTEQLLTEKEESFRKAEAKFQLEQRALEERIASLCETIASNKEAYQKMITKVSEVVNGSFVAWEAVVQKFDTEFNNYGNCILEVYNDLNTVKSWVRDANNAKRRLGKEVCELAEQLKVKKEEELFLKHQVEKVKAHASEEEAEKGKLTIALNRIEKKAEELETTLKDKDEAIFGLGEEKREAIRQLCIWIDYHRGLNDDLKEMLAKTRPARGQRAGS
ncbi:COP1-interactive protein 1-like [Syzygium oleosum]|uniref:COP1-interactive protein 1-like n=1 Tax=Syzygium oleosum TaxID=219896 RepID=UPI0024BB032A|nr:COP1-interactive protein 1-like [Syzygium oleosum]